MKRRQLFQEAEMVLGPLQAAEVQGKTWPMIYSLQSKDAMSGFLENMKSGNEHLA